MSVNRAPIADLHARLSELRAEDLNEAGASKGLVEHERLLREFVGRLGWRVGEVIIENDLTDDGRPKPASAYKRKRVLKADGTTELRVIRPGFHHLLNRLRLGASQAFVTVDLDRIVRDPRDLEDLIDVLKASGGNVRSLTGSIHFTDGGTDAEATLARVLVAFANKSSRDTGRRVRAARLRKAMAGEWGGGPRPFGWEPGGLTARPGEAEVVRAASRAVLLAVPLRSIMRDLNAAEVPTVSGAPWTASTLKGVLLRPRNAGCVVYDKRELPGVVGLWEPLIALETLRAVRAILGNPDRDMRGGRAPRWLGSGLYLCRCGSPMQVDGGGSAGRLRYVCKQQQRGGQGTGPHTRRAQPALDRYVERAAVLRLNRPDAVDLFAPAAATSAIDPRALREESAALSERMLQDARDEAADLMTRTQLLERTRNFRARQQAIDNTLTATAKVSLLTGIVGISEQAWAELPLGIRRAAVDRLLTVHVLAAPSGRGFREESVRLDWKG